MRYFTPQLFVRLQECHDASTFGAVNAAWEQAAQQYWAQLQQLTPELSRDLRRFVCWGSMHDARVLEIGTMRQLSLTYSLVDAPVIDRTALPGEHQSLPTSWLYDELERDSEMLFNVRLRIQDRASDLPAPATAQAGWRPIFLHSILLSNGWEIRLRFHRLAATRTTSLFCAAEPLLLAPEGTAIGPVTFPRTA
jgi:hypothetical protein